MPHDLVERNIEKQKIYANKDIKGKHFFIVLSLVTKKWIVHGNPKRLKVWVHSVKADPSKPE